MASAIDQLLSEETKPDLWTFNAKAKAVNGKIAWAIYNDHLYARPKQVEAIPPTWAKCGPICHATNFAKHKGLLVRTTNLVAFIPNADFDYSKVPLPFLPPRCPPRQ